MDARSPAEIELEEQIEEAKADLLFRIQQPYHSVIETGSINNERLGALLREYVAEADHGGWEGFSFQERLGINAFLADLARYYKFSIAGQS